jgi:hypothetical protein
MTRNTLLRVLLGLALFCTGVLFAQQRMGPRHPNLAAAHRLCSQAVVKIHAAQEANEFDMDGHAQKAKDLLEEAERQLKQAAEAATKNHK